MFLNRSASTFDVVVLRDLVQIVFESIQECSRQFHRQRAPNAATATGSSELEYQQNCAFISNPLAAAYWTERLYYESVQGGSLTGLWNFPAAVLVVLFYVYFVNRIQQFNRSEDPFCV